MSDSFISEIPNWLYPEVRRRIGNPHDAEDVVAATQARVWVAAERGLMPEPSRAFVRAVSRNHQRSEARRGLRVEGSGWFPDPYVECGPRERFYDEALWTDDVRDPATGEVSTSSIERSQRGRKRPKQRRDPGADLAAIPLELVAGPEDAALYADLRAAIHCELDELDEYLVTEHLIGDRTFVDLAHELGTTSGALRGRFFRALERLRESLTEWR